MALAPITGADRIGELDVLRGFALLGVFVVHFTGLNYWELPMEAATRAAWQADPWQTGAAFASDVLFHNKANTLFATLFGMGFWVMMTRLSARRAGFERLYLRRLGVLLLIGFANLIFVFPGDVLHEYAMAGFLLFALRGLPPRAMLGLGLALAFLAEPTLLWLADALRDAPAALPETDFNDERYLPWVAKTFAEHLDREIVEGGLFGWLLYVLGRFLLGAWIVRAGWLAPGAVSARALRRAATWGIGAGGAMELVSELMIMDVVGRTGWAAEALHVVGAPVMAFGYAAGLVWLFRSARGGALACWFAPVGRVALTAYVLHGAVFLVVYFPFGLAMAGTLPPLGGLALSLALFAAVQAAATRWLGRYRYGPLEYLWRWATYGARPTLRRAGAAA